MNENRREFIKKSTTLTALSLSGLGATGTAAIGRVDSSETAFKRVERTTTVKSDMKIALQARTEPSEEDLSFIHQLSLTNHPGDLGKPINDFIKQVNA